MSLLASLWKGASALWEGGVSGEVGRTGAPLVFLLTMFAYVLGSANDKHIALLQTGQNYLNIQTKNI